MNTDTKILMPNKPKILKLPKRLDAILKLPSQYITFLPGETTQSASSIMTMKRKRLTYSHHCGGHWPQATGLTAQGHGTGSPLPCAVPAQASMPFAEAFL